MNGIKLHSANCYSKTRIFPSFTSRMMFTSSVLGLVLAATTSVSAHWRSSGPSNTTEIHITGSHLNATAYTAHQLSTRAVWLQQEYIDAHNNERAKHGAKALVWDDSLSASALAWANQCKFEVRTSLGLLVSWL